MRTTLPASSSATPSRHPGPRALRLWEADRQRGFSGSRPLPRRMLGPCGDGPRAPRTPTLRRHREPLHSVPSCFADPRRLSRATWRRPATAAEPRGSAPRFPKSTAAERRCRGKCLRAVSPFMKKDRVSGRCLPAMHDLEPRPRPGDPSCRGLAPWPASLQRAGNVSASIVTSEPPARASRPSWGRRDSCPTARPISSRGGAEASLWTALAALAARRPGRINRNRTIRQDDAVRGTRLRSRLQNA